MYLFVRFSRFTAHFISVTLLFSLHFLFLQVSCWQSKRSGRERGNGRCVKQPLRFSGEQERRKYEKISRAVNKNDALSKLIFITVTWHLQDNLYRDLIYLFSGLSLIFDLKSIYQNKSVTFGWKS